jgi:hypothetical protein
MKSMVHKVQWSLIPGLTCGLVAVMYSVRYRVWYSDSCTMELVCVCVCVCVRMCGCVYNVGRYRQVLWLPTWVVYNEMPD